MRLYATPKKYRPSQQNAGAPTSLVDERWIGGQRHLEEVVQGLARLAEEKTRHQSKIGEYTNKNREDGIIIMNYVLAHFEELKIIGAIENNVTKPSIDTLRPDSPTTFDTITVHLDNKHVKEIYHGILESVEAKPIRLSIFPGYKITDPDHLGTIVEELVGMGVDKSELQTIEQRTVENFLRRYSDDPKLNEWLRRNFDRAEIKKFPRISTESHY
ncbi:MAG: hypothetical protein M1158_02275 [Candidatus Marsarchaeota archaeon]|nr:hypothetical protein [Candidatus Marsarchaeota archaeon]